MLECVSGPCRPEQKQGSEAQRGIFPREGLGVRKLWTSDWPMPRTSSTLTSLIQVCVWDSMCGSQGKMDGKAISWALELHYFPSSHSYYCFLIFFCWHIENGNTGRGRVTERHTTSGKSGARSHERLIVIIHLFGLPAAMWMLIFTGWPKLCLLTGSGPEEWSCVTGEIILLLWSSEPSVVKCMCISCKYLWICKVHSSPTAQNQCLYTEYHICCSLYLLERGSAYLGPRHLFGSEACQQIHWQWSCVTSMSWGLSGS